MPNILVIGSQGTIGQKLCNNLQGTIFQSDIVHTGQNSYYRCDISKYRQVINLFENLPKIDYTYLLAAEFGRQNGEEYYENLINTNVKGTRNILEAQKLYKFNLIFTSSSEVYGTNCPVPVKEDYYFNSNTRLLNDYALSKWMNEQQMLNFQSQYNSKIMRIRPFNSYGIGEYYTSYRSVICTFIYKLLNNLPITVYTEHARAFVYIDNLIVGLTACIDNFCPGRAINLGSSEVINMGALLQLLLDNIKTKSEITYKKIDDTAVISKYPDITLAKELLNYSVNTSLETGIKLTIDWMKDIYG